MNTLVRTTQQPINEETLQTFLELAKIFQYNPFFSGLFEELKKLKIASDIIGFIAQSIISIQSNIKQLFASIKIIISDEQLESPVDTYPDFIYWHQIFTNYLTNEQQRDYHEKYQNQFISLGDLFTFMKSFYSPKEFTVYIKTLTGQMIEFSISGQTTILEIKEMILKNNETPVDQQRLIFAGKQLDDNPTVSMYNISHESTIHLVLSLRGGMYHKSSNGKLMGRYEIMYTQMKKHMSLELCKIFDQHFEFA